MVRIMPILSQHFVVNADHAVRVLLRGAQAQLDVAMSRRHQRDAFADQNGHHVNVELVDLAGIEKRGDQPGAAHHPDVFAWCRAQPARERLDWLAHELHAGGRPFRRLSREYVVGHRLIELAVRLSLLLPVIHGPVIRLAAHKNRVDAGIKLFHAVIELVRPPIEPLDIAVGPGNVAVGAGGARHDDFALRRHNDLIDGRFYGCWLAGPSRSHRLPATSTKTATLPYGSARGALTNSTPASVIRVYAASKSSTRRNSPTRPANCCPTAVRCCSPSARASRMPVVPPAGRTTTHRLGRPS